MSMVDLLFIYVELTFRQYGYLDSLTFCNELICFMLAIFPFGDIGAFYSIISVF